MQSHAMTCNPINKGERQRRSPNQSAPHGAANDAQLSVLQRTNAALAALADPKWKSAAPVRTATRAVQQAAQCDAGVAAGQSFGPLHGKLVVWKDIIDQAGQQTTCGSALRKHVAPAQKNAAIVSQLEAAGMVSLARTGLSEFAFSGLGLNPHFGAPASALSREIPLLSGGSTSGAAVVVAHGFAELGVGTDTSGSIRIPAALNGIFGFRPTAARYNKTGVHPLSKTLDSVGTLARSFEVLRHADSTLCTDAAAPIGAKTEVLDLCETLGVPWDDDVFAPYETALRRASNAGWKITPKCLKCVDDLHALLGEYGPLVAIEARQQLAPYLTADTGQTMDPMIRARLLAAPVLSDRAYAQYLQRRRALVAQASAEIGARLLAFPTVASLRHPLAPLMQDPIAAQRLNTRLLAATMIGSLLDWPGLAVPLHANDARVEGSLLLSAAAGRDAHLLAQAARLLPEITEKHSNRKGK